MTVASKSGLTKAGDTRHSSRLAWKTRRLARVAGELAGVSAERLELVYERVLAASLRGGEHSLYGASALNNDGAPLQLVLVSGRTASDVRLIGDPYAFLGNVEARYQSSIEALRRVVEDNGDAGFTHLAEESLRAVLPATPEARAPYTEGFIWIAQSLVRRAGVGFYLEAAPLGQAAGWETAARLLRKIVPAHEDVIGLIDGMKDNTVVASIGLEGTDASNSRIKIYFRLTRPAALSELGLDLFGAPEVNRFLEMTMGSFGLDLDGLVLCLGVNAADGQLADVKIDLCGHCLTYSREQWIEVVERCIAEFDLQPLPVRAALASGACQVAFIGFAIDRDAQRRLNVYLQASEGDGVPVSDETLAALEDGIAYLCRLQDDTGKWTDFQLPVGASDQWVTAYVGLALARVGKYLQHERALDAAARSAAWLLSHQGYSAGWGYNTQTGADLDSTAVCLALLRELEIEVRDEDCAFLRRHWHDAGGFSTYHEPNAWGRPHWDVTPLGYLALAENERRELRASFLRALKEHRLAGNMWRSYWWRMPFYSTFTTLEALDELQLPEPAEPVPGDAPAQMLIDNSFDLACLVGIEILRGAPLEQTGEHARALLKWQQPNGSWRGHANLRVTDDSCYAPWETPVGEYFEDKACTITTATVLRVLTYYLGRALTPAVA
ncbi:MAG TPA: prenyltransferase/squalene oxidase repeat-containing protein [Pyrinomonadaceae bacterium]|nr:prenyltransferase/squalene oxidase repeat-containing protein [Pyrinomonadaceae bacterium]